MRTPQEAAPRGSQKWLRVLINDCPARLIEAIGGSRPDLAGTSIEWVSPLRTDRYAEYSDADFLQQLGLGQYATALQDFWPLRGPQWDGLGHSAQNTYYLIEAKAHVHELLSSCAARSPRSLEQIARAFKQTQYWLGSKSPNNWRIGYYQQANRLAHLYFLREIASVHAFLLNIHFINDYSHSPTGHEAWQKALSMQREYLDVHEEVYQTVVINVFVAVGDLCE